MVGGRWRGGGGEERRGEERRGEENRTSLDSVDGSAQEEPLTQKAAHRARRHVAYARSGIEEIMGAGVADQGVRCQSH